MGRGLLPSPVQFFLFFPPLRLLSAYQSSFYLNRRMTLRQKQGGGSRRMTTGGRSSPCAQGNLLLSA